MKQLLIIRHAKSSWDNSVKSDFERPLNERGHKDAPAMAQRLLDKDILIDAFISSTAKRAFTTATYFSEPYKKAGKRNFLLIAKPELYLAEPETFNEVITSADDKLKTIAVFAHNPGITEFANQLTSTTIDEMPTCGIFAITIDSDSWKNFTKATKSFWFFDYPKNI